jgi:hypothetical protein
MPKYYIQAEAFNLDNTVYDTHDISTIRGGSFILLDAVKRLPKAIPLLEPIATAASKGLFAYEDPGDLDAQRTGMEQQVLTFLHNATEGHATFLVAVVEDIPNDFPLVLERLDAEVRRQQWRMPTIVVPLFEDTDQECYLDGWRPGVKPYTVDPDVLGAKISTATYYRRQRGRELKHTLFRELFLKDGAKDDICAKDLGELATDESKGILSGKIAFIHVDGNNFGRIRKKKCITPEARKEFDARIQKYREAFLNDLRNNAYSDPDFCLSRKGKDVLRLEVLLWGGDECTIIVPAWKGLEVLERFYKITAGLKFEDIPMTHRAAVIFCHHDAPILQIRRLADRLLGITKKDIKKQFEAAFAEDPTLTSLDAADRSMQLIWLSNANYGNAARYLVLESFDILRGPLEQFLKRYYGKEMAETGDMLLYGNRMSELRINMRIICAAAPKGRVVELARAFSQGDATGVNELRERLIESVAPDQRDVVLAAIDTLTKGNDARWYLLADLWDYLEEWKA